MTTPHPQESGFDRELRLVCRYDRDYGTDLGIPPPDPSHHALLAAHAALAGNSLNQSAPILAADGLTSLEAIPWEQLDGQPIPSQDVAKTLHYVITELVRNVLEHAAPSSGAFIRAAFLDNPARIGVGVADRGIGVRRSLSRFHRVPDDRVGVALAVTPGITSSTPRLGGNEVNAGAGLFFTLGLAAMSGTGFLLVSGSAAWHLIPRNMPSASPEEGFAISLADVGWKGTVVAVDLPLALPRSRKELFLELNRAYAKRVKAGRSDFYRRRSLMGDDL